MSPTGFSSLSRGSLFGFRGEEPHSGDIRPHPIAIVLGALVAAGVFAGVALRLAKRAIRVIDPPLPVVEEILAYGTRADLQVRTGRINTASQRMLRSPVLDPARRRRTR